MVKCPHSFWTSDDAAYSGGEHRVEQNCSLKGKQKEEWTEFHRHPTALSWRQVSPSRAFRAHSRSKLYHRENKVILTALWFWKGKISNFIIYILTWKEASKGRLEGWREGQEHWVALRQAVEKTLPSHIAQTEHFPYISTESITTIREWGYCSKQENGQSQDTFPSHQRIETPPQAWKFYLKNETKNGSCS